MLNEGEIKIYSDVVLFPWDREDSKWITPLEKQFFVLPADKFECLLLQMKDEHKLSDFAVWTHLSEIKSNQLQLIKLNFLMKEVSLEKFLQERLLLDLVDTLNKLDHYEWR